MRGLKFECKFDRSCLIASGHEALKLYKFNKDPVVGVFGDGSRYCTSLTALGFVKDG